MSATQEPLLTLDALLFQQCADTIPKNSRAWAAMTSGGVSRTSEWHRIDRLPRRDWMTDPNTPRIRQLATEWLRTPNGTVTLHTQQAIALTDAYNLKGGFFPLDVGEGKALISMLIPTVIGDERPMILVPASVYEQTIRDVIPWARANFRVRDDIEKRVVAYSTLSHRDSVHLLEEYKPTSIIADEGHRLKSKTAAGAMRIANWMTRNPETMFFVMSGSFQVRGLMDWWRSLIWSLKPDRAPLPVVHREAETWAMAVDPDVPHDKEVGGGALMVWAHEGETATQALGRRLRSTPGVVVSDPEFLGIELKMIERKLEVPKVVRDHIQQLEETWETPKGLPIAEHAVLWAKMRELACGFYMYWDPAPPPGWLEARKAWTAFVRDRIRRKIKGQDSEALVAAECARRVKKGEPFVEYQAWTAIRDRYDPEKHLKAEWISTFMAEDAAEWLRECKRKGDGGIVWVERTALGDKIAELSGCRFFHGGVRDNTDIRTWTEPMIASVAANAEGKNLQDRYSRNLICTPSPTGKIWQQKLGRTHRIGQKRSLVTSELYLHTAEMRAALRDALVDAKAIEDTFGRKQKLLIADRQGLLL